MAENGRDNLDGSRKHAVFPKKKKTKRLRLRLQRPFHGRWLANCSADKAKIILNYKKEISLDESLTKIIDYIKTKGKKKFEYSYDLEIINEKTPKTWVEKKF